MLGPVAAHLMSAAGPVPGVDPLTAWLVGQGTLGIVCGLVLAALRKESKRADAERARADAVATTERAKADAVTEKFVGLVERVLPALAESTRASEELVQLSREDRRRGRDR